MAIHPSELILNKDGGIYHLSLLPNEIADTIITVGDPERVQSVTKYFDTIEVKKQNREFLTHTGTLAGKNITVISTGIGTDNIDIVFNELDALANINLKLAKVKTDLRQLNFIRIGTSGSIQNDIPLNSLLISESALGFDGVMHYYRDHKDRSTELIDSFIDFMGSSVYDKCRPYISDCDHKLLELFSQDSIYKGLTATNSGFYGPQGRVLRLELADSKFIQKLALFKYKDSKISNLEMETAGIYGFAKLLGHRAISLNAILANRSTGEFSKTPEKTIDNLIRFTLETITTSNFF